MPTPWAGYIRVSHVGGREGERFRSPKEQADRIEAWARSRGEEVVLLAPELDESGGRVDRPILTEAVAGIERGRYRGLVVAYLSRASRSVKHLLDLWERIETAGGEGVAVAESIDTPTPAGRLTRTVLAAIAEHELDLHRERFEELRRIATANGIWQRRQAPLGYRRDPHTRRLVPDENARRVRSAFRSRAQGRSILQIARELGRTPSGARNLLRNRVYLAELVKLEPRASSGPRVDELRAELRAAQRELEAYLEGVAAAGLSVEQYAKGARLRRDELDRRRETLAEALARQAAPLDGDPLRVWKKLNPRQRNQLLRGLFECVLVAPAGRGRRVLITGRVRVIAFGAGVVPPYRGGG